MASAATCTLFACCTRHATRVSPAAPDHSVAELTALLLRKKRSLRRFFLASDLNRDGRLSRDELACALRSLEPRLAADRADEVARALIAAGDTDANGQLSLGELLRIAGDETSRAFARRACADAVLKMGVLLFVYLPVLAVLIGLALGGPLAWLEGWSFADGFWLVLAEVRTRGRETRERARARIIGRVVLSGGRARGAALCVLCAEMVSCAEMVATPPPSPIN